MPKTVTAQDFFSMCQMSFSTSGMQTNRWASEICDIMILFHL